MARAKKGSGLMGWVLVGAALGVAGVVWGLLVVNRVGQQALDHDPSPLYGPLALAALGTIFLTVARVKRVFRSRGKSLAEDAAKRGIGEVLDDL